MSTWTPGRRRQQLTLETPFEGVPSHLSPPLWHWVHSVIGGTGFDSELVRGIGLELRIPLPNEQNLQTRMAVINRINHYATEDDGFFLDLIEYILEVRLQASVWDRREPWAPEGAADVLERILEMGNSAYRVRHDRGGLEMRTMPEVQERVQEVVNSSGAAGVHLTGAWNAAYSRTPDPVKSYSESIKAVEAALAGKISPQNAKQTLGTMIRDVSSKPSKWTFAIADGTNSDGVDTVLGMMRLLWEGQRSRHGGPNTQPETVEEAQAAIALATTLVQFGVSGAFDLA